jgi:hypothetical protein
LAVLSVAYRRPPEFNIRQRSMTERSGEIAKCFDAI